jgi:signal peptidase I
MITLTRKSLNSLITMCCFCLLVCAIICSNVYSESKSKSTFQEIEKDGRVYVFSSLTRMDDFNKSGEVGKSIIKIGYGPNGETVVFDSEEAVYNYDSKQMKQILDRMRIRAYKEFEKDSRIYVFTSPRRKASFDKSGEMGKDYIAKIGYGQNGKTVLFDSQDAVEEYDSRHEVITGAATETNYFYQQIKIDGRVYAFTSLERMNSFGKSGELGKGIIKVGYGLKGETVVFDSDKAIKEYQKRNIR